jgi:hypothetical protein
VRGAGAFWTAHRTGHNVVDPATGSNRWVDGGKTANQSYLVLDGANQTATAEAIGGTINSLMCKGN